MHRTYSHIFLKYKSIWLEENKRQCTVCHRLRTLDYFHQLRVAKDGYKDKCIDCVTLNKESILSPKFDWIKTRTYKHCMACGQEKLINDFVASPNFTLDGSAYVCKECDSNYQPISKDRSKYHRTRRSNIKENQPIRYQKERDKTNKRNKERYANDPQYRETIKTRNKDFKLNNKEYYSEYNKNYNKINREELNEYCKQYNKKYPKYNIASKHNRKARELNNGGSFSPNFISNQLIQQNYLCAYCSINIKDGYQLEHILPISKKGTNNEYNLVLSCEQCNKSKNDKLLWLEWRPTNVNKLVLYKLNIYSLILL